MEANVPLAQLGENRLDLRKRFAAVMKVHAVETRCGDTAGLHFCVVQLRHYPENVLTYGPHRPVGPGQLKKVTGGQKFGNVQNRDSCL